MPVLAFELTTADHESRRHEFRGKNKSEYYDGDLNLMSTNLVDMRIEKSIVNDYSIYKLTSSSGLTFRRTWAHIRHDKTNVTVFWFVRRGRIAISYPGTRHMVEPDECAVTRSTRPFFMELTPDETGSLEAMHVVVPSHRIYSVLNENVDVGRPFPTSSGDLLLAERIFTMLFEEDDKIDPSVAEQLIETLMNSLGKTITGDAPVRITIPDQRIADITRYINQHFANSDLNAAMVADGCGISLRYLCHILKKNGLSFSSLVWERRRETAHAWLKEQRMQHHSISEIAYLAGFKSSAHFSRMFKATYGIAPSDFRSLHADDNYVPCNGQPSEDEGEQGI